MASRLLLFATPIAIVVLVLRVPANGPVPPRDEVRLAHIDPERLTDSGEYLSTTVTRPRPAVAPVSRQPTSLTARSTVRQVAYESGDRSVTATRPVERTPRAVSQPEDRVARLRVLSERYWLEPNSREAFADGLFQLAQSIYFEPGLHFVAPHVVQPGETLQSIAKHYRVTWEYLANVNQLDPRQVRTGFLLKVTPGPFSAIVEKSRHVLTVHAHGHVVAAFDVGLGKPDPFGETSTPTGTFFVADRVTNPTWYGPDQVIDAHDPANPLGEYWLGLADEHGRGTSLGIHGTIEPESVGHNQSDGCIRLRGPDIERLFRLLPVGAVVEIRE